MSKSGGADKYPYREFEYCTRYLNDVYNVNLGDFIDVLVGVNNDWHEAKILISNDPDDSPAVIKGYRSRTPEEISEIDREVAERKEADEKTRAKEKLSEAERVKKYIRKHPEILKELNDARKRSDNVS